MSVLPVRIYGDPVLKRAGAPVERFDQSCAGSSRT